MVKKLGVKTVKPTYFPKKKIAILGWYGDFNVGNDAILSGMIEALKKAIPNSSFLTFSWHPKLIAQQNNIQVLPYYKIIQSIPKIDVLLVGGGTILTDWQLAYPIFLSLMATMAWAKMLGKKVVLYAAGAEPFSNKIAKNIAQAVFNTVDLITVRGHRSKNALKNLKINKPIRVTVDPALMLQPEDEKIVDKILNQKITKTEGAPRITIALRDVKGETKKEVFKKYIADVLDNCIEHLGAEIIFLPISTSLYDDDRKIMAEIIKEMKHPTKTKLVTQRLTPQQTITVVKNSDLVISMRLHALIFATITHTPTIALTGRVNTFVPPSSNKISEFLERLNLQDTIFNYSNMNNFELIEKITSKLQPNQHAKLPLNNIQKLKAICMQNAKLVKNLLQ